MSMGMLITFMMSFMQPYFKLRYEIPKSVILKATLYNGYVDYKNGTHKLKIIDAKLINDDGTTNEKNVAMVEEISETIN